MIVSTKGRYALRVMIDLAEHRSEKYVPLKEVAARQEISEKYLENILKVLVQNGFLEGLRGKGTAGEWGHNPLPWMDEDELRYREEVPCYCGKQGCIETFISGTGFATDYRRLSGHALKGSEIISLVEESDPVAELALRRYELRLAKSLAHVVNILDPDVIVLGGGMSNVDRLYQTVPQLIKQFVFGGECETPVRKAKHGDSSGVRGAAWLWPQE